MPEWKDLLAVVATLVASFAGAWAAFALEGRRRDGEMRAKNVGAANRAIYTLFNLWNVLEQYRKEALEPSRGAPHSWLNLAANPTIPTGESHFQVSDLQFLLQTKQAEIFAKLLLEEQRFAIAIDLIRSRSTLVLKKVFPAMSAAQIKVGQSVDLQRMEAVLGIDVVHQLKELTSAIYTNVDEDLVSLKETYDALTVAMKAVYPRTELLKIVFEVPRHDA